MTKFRYALARLKVMMIAIQDRQRALGDMMERYASQELGRAFIDIGRVIAAHSGQTVETMGRGGVNNVDDGTVLCDEGTCTDCDQVRRSERTARRVNLNRVYGKMAQSPNFVPDWARDLPIMTWDELFDAIGVGKTQQKSTTPTMCKSECPRCDETCQYEQAHSSNHGHGKTSKSKRLEHKWTNKGDA